MPLASCELHMGLYVAAVCLFLAATSSETTIQLTTTGIPTEMAITWTESGEPRSTTTLQWGSSPRLDHTVQASARVMHTRTENMSTYDYCGAVLETHTVHTAHLTGLPTDAQIWYAVGNGSMHSFRTPPSEPAAELRFFATADMGDPVSHDWTAIPQMASQCAAAGGPPVQLGLHVGDIAYNLDIPPRGDDYIKGVSGMSSAFPWMMVPGNHESDCNYTYANYNARFQAQNLTAANGVHSASARWYSFEMGPVHFIAIDTDAWGFDEVAPVLRPQFEWLEADLQALDRSRTPWVVLMGHRPMYCSSVTAQSSAHLGWPKQAEHEQTPEPLGYGDGFRALGLSAAPWAGMGRSAAGIPPCGVAEMIREGLPTRTGGRAFAVEPLMAQYGVDVYLTGHEHNYERLWPTLNGSVTKSYLAPKKPVHVVTGAGGAYAKDLFGEPGPWDAFRSSEWSYSDVVVNRTHFSFLQRLATNGSVIDSFVLTRE